MEHVRCKHENLELQRLLESNFELLAGEQIEPDDPPRWLLVKREMPVPDPSTGDNRWSIDFFFLDQDAMPTFVECKRSLIHGLDARSLVRCWSTLRTGIIIGLENY